MYCDPRDLHVLTHSFPTRRSSDLVDIDDALLRFFDVAVCGLQKFGDDAFDIFADIAGLGQRGGVDHDEWHVESASDRAGEKRFAGYRWADQIGSALCRERVCPYVSISGCGVSLQKKKIKTKKNIKID